MSCPSGLRRSKMYDDDVEEVKRVGREGEGFDMHE